jgi:hypothetical protein
MAAGRGGHNFKDKGLGAGNSMARRFSHRAGAVPGRAIPRQGSPSRISVNTRPLQFGGFP